VRTRDLTISKPKVCGDEVFAQPAVSYGFCCRIPALTNPKAKAICTPEARVLRMSVMDCFACNRIEQIRANTNPHFIAELSESYAVLSDEQPYEGWTILLLKDHHEELAGLPLQRQARLWDDVAKVAGAITRELKPVRINYENLGNQLHHIHWHVIPRHANDPAPTMPIWTRGRESLRVFLEPADEARLITRLRRALEIG